MSVRIGVLSDTHDLLRPEVTAALSGCARILHGGDIACLRILERLREIAPVEAVRGNNDKGEWAESLPWFLETDAVGLRVFMTHKRKDLPGDTGRYDLVIFGHSHRYSSEWREAPGGRRTLLLNPGSCGPRRFGQPATLALLTVEKDGFDARCVRLPDSPGDRGPALPAGDMRQTVRTVVRETQRGRTVGDIARRCGLEEALVEQIARLYLTHPGVDEDGILNRMGL